MINCHIIKQDYSQAIAEWQKNGGVIKKAVNQYQYKLNTKEERLHGKKNVDKTGFEQSKKLDFLFKKRIPLVNIERATSGMVTVKMLSECYWKMKPIDKDLFSLVLREIGE